MWVWRGEGQVRVKVQHKVQSARGGAGGGRLSVSLLACGQLQGPGEARGRGAATASTPRELRSSDGFVHRGGHDVARTSNQPQNGGTTLAAGGGWWCTMASIAGHPAAPAPSAHRGLCAMPPCMAAVQESPSSA